jgi:hypothetical protein
MRDRGVELQLQIDQVIERLQEVQRHIAGSRQPASRIELQTLQELGRSYAQLHSQLQDWYDIAPGERSGDD